MSPSCDLDRIVLSIALHCSTHARAWGVTTVADFFFRFFFSRGGGGGCKGRLNAIDGLDTIAITTNALVLHRKLPKLVEAGLTHVNISLDTLMDFKFEVISRRKGFHLVMKGIDSALELGLPVKLNCVAMKGFNDDEIVDFVAMTKDKDVDIRFIEYMPFGGNKWSEGRFLSYADMVALIQESYPDFAPIDALKAEVTAKAWKVPGHAGQIGFITSMSDHFCGDCNRLRMTHDGNLKVRRVRRVNKRPARVSQRVPPGASLNARFV